MYRSTMQLGSLAVLVGVFGAGCAPYRSLNGQEKRPMVASLMPLPAPPLPPPPALAPLDEDASAGELLERGFLFFHQDRPDLAAESFAGAIATGSLNDAGRALAYWHIAEAERRQYHEDATAEALASFATVAEQVIEMRGERRFAIDENGDFIDHFKLELRVAEARGALNALWARRVRHYGRSLANPVICTSAEEIDFFIRHASPCSGTEGRVLEREELAAIDGVPIEGRRVERITVFCSSIDSSDQFYVVLPDAAPPPAASELDPGP